MAFVKLHIEKPGSMNEAVLVNTDNILRIERHEAKTQLHFVAPSGGGYATLVVNENFQEVEAIINGAVTAA